MQVSLEQVVRRYTQEKKLLIHTKHRDAHKAIKNTAIKPLHVSTVT